MIWGFNFIIERIPHTEIFFFLLIAIHRNCLYNLFKPQSHLNIIYRRQPMAMLPNPVLKKLGLKNDDRVAIIHTDDIGMCQASVEAFADLNEAGIISSGAVMVPCPWFLHAASYARQHPQADLGIHLTLTSEWDTYRWGPISTRDPALGLMDAQGFFHHQSEPVQNNGDPTAVETELNAQVERAVQAGIAPTHIDTHMGTVAHPKFMGIYIQLAFKHHLPVMIFRMDEAGWQAAGLDPEFAKMAAAVVGQLEDSGLPLLDSMAAMNLDSAEDRLERTKQALSELKPGITHFIIHPSKDTPELRAITPDWSCRVGDYQDFMNEELRRHIQKIGLHVIGYRALKELLPAA
jgi:chitin disaccharide deacetylase